MPRSLFLRLHNTPASGLPLHLLTFCCAPVALFHQNADFDLANQDTLWLAHWLPKQDLIQGSTQNCTKVTLWDDTRLCQFNE